MSGYEVVELLDDGGGEPVERVRHRTASQDRAEVVYNALRKRTRNAVWLRIENEILMGSPTGKGAE